MNSIVRAIENKVIVHKYVWIAIWVFNIFILLSLFVDYGRPFIDFLYFVSGGD